MKCKRNLEIKIFEYNNKFCIGIRDEYGPICKISEFDSKEEAINNLRELSRYRFTCDLCNSDSLCNC